MKCPEKVLQYVDTICVSESSRTIRHSLCWESNATFLQTERDYDDITTSNVECARYVSSPIKFLNVSGLVVVSTVI